MQSLAIVEHLDSSGNHSEVLHFCREIFSQVIHFIEMGIESWIWFLAVGFPRDHGFIC